MEPLDDVPGVMHFGPDEPVEDALLGGALTPDDTPPELRHVAELVAAMRAPARADELGQADRVVAAVAAEVRTRTPETASATRRKGMLGTSLVAKLAVAAAGILGVTAAGAAAGALPGPAQSTIAGALSHVGVSVPDPGHHHDSSGPNGTTTEVSEPAEPTTTPSTGPGAGDDSSGHEAEPHAGAVPPGLCQAVASGAGGEHGAKLDAASFRSLEDTARARGESVDELCAGVTTGGGHDHHDGATAGAPQPGEDHHTGAHPESSDHGGAQGNDHTTVSTTAGHDGGTHGDHGHDGGGQGSGGGQSGNGNDGAAGQGAQGGN